jgi:hypothetical protein
VPELRASMRGFAGVATCRLGLLRRAWPDGTRTPNTRTRAALDDAAAGRNVERYDIVDALLGEAGGYIQVNESLPNPSLLTGPAPAYRLPR